MKKKIIGIAVAALVVIAAVVFFIQKSGNRQPVTFITEKLVPSEITNSVTATGTVEPIIQVEVGTQVSGIISKIYVDFNSQVKAGQLIAEIDRSLLETELQASNAQVSSTQSEYEYQTINFNRQKGLYEKTLISASEYESAKYAYEKAKYAYNQSLANIKKARKNLGYTQIYSPIDGVVLSRAVDEGQTVAAGFSTPTLFTIAKDLRKMQVIAKVDEADIGVVTEKQNVDFTVDAFPDDSFKGVVTQVRLQPTTEANVVTYEVVIDAPNPDMKLKPGLTANVNIITAHKEGIITVPQRALRFVPEGAERPAYAKCVWVKGATGAPEPREVTVGITDGIRTEIISGLNEGEEILCGISTNFQSNNSQAGPDAMNGNKGEQGSSPFMPKRPNRGSNVRTK